MCYNSNKYTLKKKWPKKFYMDIGNYDDLNDILTFLWLIIQPQWWQLNMRVALVAGLNPTS